MPTRSDIRWQEVVSLIEALGGSVSERAGSRVGVHLNGAVAVFHRPHDPPIVRKYAVEAVREFLANAGVEKS